MNQPPRPAARPQNSRGPQRHHNRRRYRGQGGSGPKNNEGQGQQQNARPPRPRDEGNRPQFHIQKLIEKYNNLLEQHLIARRKFHDMYYRADNNQRIKFEKNFYQTLYDLRDFERNMAPDVQTEFNKRVNGHREDLTYSLNRNLKDIDNVIETEMAEISDPHILSIQKAHDYSQDKEESTGTLDDYNRYKNF